MCRAKGTFSACLGPRCSLARRGSARFSECAPYDHISLSLLHTRTHSSSLFLSLQTPLTTASRLLSSFFYSLVNAPFVNRPRVGFRKIPIANRLGSLDWSIWLEFDWQADDLTPFFWFFSSYSLLFFRIVI